MRPQTSSMVVTRRRGDLKCYIELECIADLDPAGRSEMQVKASDTTHFMALFKLMFFPVRQRKRMGDGPTMTNVSIMSSHLCISCIANVLKFIEDSRCFRSLAVQPPRRRECFCTSRFQGSERRQVRGRCGG